MSNILKSGLGKSTAYLLYEDLNDHDHLSKDQMLAVAVGKTDPTGMDRKAIQLINQLVRNFWGLYF